MLWPHQPRPGLRRKDSVLLASLIDSKEETEIDHVVHTIPDPVGTFYRYCSATIVAATEKAPMASGKLRSRLVEVAYG